MKYAFIKTSLLIVFVYGLWSCGPANKVNYTWSNNGFKLTNPVTKIFVAALVKNPHVREHLEEEMASSTRAQGYIAEKSRDYFMPNIAEKSPPPVESMMDKIKSLNCELIFTINLVDKQSETRYQHGGMSYFGPYPGYGLHFRGFYTYWYPYIYDPGYYVTDKTYFMEGNLFDTASGTLIWTIQTESLNPNSIEKFSKELIDMMMRKAIADLGYIRNR
jgi:hypothetical protein